MLIWSNKNDHLDFFGILGLESLTFDTFALFATRICDVLISQYLQEDQCLVSNDFLFFFAAVSDI